jgi:hypothetical protein
MLFAATVLPGIDIQAPAFVIATVGGRTAKRFDGWIVGQRQLDQAVAGGRQARLTSPYLRQLDHID